MIRNKCRYHCRDCDSCFTSLLAFDLHRDKGECLFPEEIDYDEVQGLCLISSFDEEAEPLEREKIIYKLQISEEQKKKLQNLNETN